ncbi:MAG: undecaprenyl-diphosphatase [Bacillota bacterium]|nr:MAG: undecaprenyl-diphosphatase [Bacillota bacterium]MBS3949920.1 undecaprenyl-diphosphate phosphatase [Peptococcaceae bacterium]
MTLGAVILLAIIQGLTEFFPVSSSGHLVLGQYFLGVQSPGVALEVALHLGTVISIIVVYYSDILGLVQGFFSFFLDPKGLQSKKHMVYRKLIVLLVLGSVPTALIGILFIDTFERLFASPQIIGYTLIITGIILTISSRMQGRKPLDKITGIDAVIVGVGQGLAITPGISRSGLTISTALLRGLDRDAATRFSFLLSLPAILGAAILKMPTLMDGTIGYPLWWVLVGVAVSALTGIFAIRGLMSVLRQGKLQYFAYYTWVLGLITIVFVR